MNKFNLFLTIILLEACSNNPSIKRDIANIDDGEMKSNHALTTNEFRDQAIEYYTTHGINLPSYRYELSFYPNLKLERTPNIINTAIQNIKNKGQLDLFKSIIKFSSNFKSPHISQYIHKLVEHNFITQVEADAVIEINNKSKRHVEMLAQTIDGHSVQLDVMSNEYKNIAEISEWIETESQFRAFSHLLNITTSPEELVIAYKFENLYQAELVNHFKSIDLRTLYGYFHYINLIENSFQKETLLKFVKETTKKKNVDFGKLEKRMFESIPRSYWDIFKQIKNQEQADVFISSIFNNGDIKVYLSKQVLTDFFKVQLITAQEYEEFSSFTTQAKNMFNAYILLPKDYIVHEGKLYARGQAYRSSYEKLSKMTDMIKTQQELDLFTDSIKKKGIQASNDGDLLHLFGMIEELDTPKMVLENKSGMSECKMALSKIFKAILSYK